jgi:hypothetical protein
MSANSIASGKKRTDIPANASPVYTDSGWVGWGDWLLQELREKGPVIWEATRSGLRLNFRISRT